MTWQGRLEFLKGCTDIQMNKGDVLCIHTNAGGGYGVTFAKVASKASINYKY
jgi:N-methylhydantoinase B/oxoprolinase/acetone carboxylase alpha subunit